MKELTVEERKKLGMEILDLIHAFCLKNNIRCYLDSGTLLGAVRHKGFIPWDDDIDISMPRPDYEKFLKIFKEEGCYISSYRTGGRRLVTPFAKVCSNKTYGTTLTGKKLPYGVAVDIFPIDGYPKGDSAIQKYFKKQLKVFHRYLFLISLETTTESKSFIKHIVKEIIKFFISSRTLARMVDNRARKNHFENSEKAGCSVALYFGDLTDSQRASFDKGILMSFEDREYFVPQNYKDVLEKTYGPDYMTPPPVDKRVSTHTENYYWVENN